MFKHASIIFNPKKSTRCVALSTTSNATQRQRATARCISSVSLVSRITFNNSASHPLRVFLGLAVLPIAAPSAAKPGSRTMLFSSLISSNETFVKRSRIAGSILNLVVLTRIRRIAQARPCRMVDSPSLPLSTNTSLNSNSCVVSTPSIAQDIPITLAALSRIPSSGCTNNCLDASNAAGTLSGSLTFDPPCSNTAASASRVAVWTTVAAKPSTLTFRPREPVTNSLINGSTRVAKGINNDNAAIASTRTCLDGSDKAFTKVV